MLPRELCKGRTRWDFPSHPLWLQGLLGQCDTTQLEWDKINQSVLRGLGASGEELGWVCFGNLEPLLSQPGQRRVVSRHRSVRPPVLHDLLPRLLPQISDRELCWLHAEMPEWAAWLPQGPKW